MQGRRGMVFSFERLETWREAVRLAKAVYQISGALPADEKFGLTSQLRRAAVSVSANIAEGNGRGHHRELTQYLSQARGSLYEVVSLAAVAKELGLLTEPAHAQLRDSCELVQSKLAGLMRSVQARAALLREGSVRYNTGSTSQEAPPAFAAPPASILQPPVP